MHEMKPEQIKRCRNLDHDIGNIIVACSEASSKSNCSSGQCAIKSVGYFPPNKRQQKYVLDEINSYFSRRNTSLVISSFRVQRDKYMCGDWTNTGDGDWPLYLIIGLTTMGTGFLIAPVFYKMYRCCFPSTYYMIMWFNN